MFAIRQFAVMLRNRLFQAAFVLCAIFAMDAVGKAGISYTLTDLGTLPGWPSAYGTAINDSAQITGDDFSSMPYQTGFLYSGGQLQDLGGVESYGTGINNAGQVVGYTVAPGGNDHAFVFSNGKMVDLNPPGSPRSRAFGINDRGQAVGYISNTSPDPFNGQAALFSGGAVQNLGALTPGGDSIAQAINQSGEIVGNTTFPGGGSVTHAFLYANGVMQDLGTLGGPFSYSDAVAINSSGQVVGYADTPTGDHVFLYSNGIMHDMGTLPGTHQSASASSINDAGEIVGSSRDENNGQEQAFLYVGGTMYNLNDLIINGQGYDVTQASGINNSGQIVAWAPMTEPGTAGIYRAVLLTPVAVPVPAAAWAALAVLPLLLPAIFLRKWIVGA